MSETERSRKRPILVWVISIFYVLSFLFTLLAFYRVASNPIPATAQIQTYEQRLTAFDYFLSGAQALLGISAAIALFMMRRVAFQLFYAALIVSVLATVWEMFGRGEITALRSIGDAPIGALIGLVILLAVLLYTRHLRSRGMLA